MQPTHAKQARLPMPKAIAPLPTTPALPATAALPTTAALPATAALPTTPALRATAALPTTPALSTTASLAVTESIAASSPKAGSGPGMQEILPGIWHWTARHPRIGQEVSSYYLADSGTVLDPIAPGALGDRPVRQVVLTNRLHSRDAGELGVPVRVPEAGLGHFDDKPFAVEPYAPGDELAPGVRALELAAISPDDGVLHIDGTALHFADGLRVGDGELALMPDALMDDPETVKTKTFARLEELLELDFDALLFAHSDPIATGGRAQLEAFVSR
jgi:hypothetical protein